MKFKIVSGKMSDIDIFLQDNLGCLLHKEEILDEVGKEGFDLLLKDGRIEEQKGKWLIK